MTTAQFIGIYAEFILRNKAKFYITTHLGVDSLNPLSNAPPSHTVKLWRGTKSGGDPV